LPYVQIFSKDTNKTLIWSVESIISEREKDGVMMYTLDQLQNMRYYSVPSMLQFFCVI